MADRSQVFLSQTVPKPLKLREVTGDIFNAPLNSVLLHACNCKGSWGAGIAAAFRTHYPLAYEKYKSHCASIKPANLVGTAYLIAPVDANGSQHYIGCLFTSIGFGKSKDSSHQILFNTDLAMKDALRQILVLKDNGTFLSDVQMCQINSGYFGVPWMETRTLLKTIEIDRKEDIEISVISKI